MLKELTYKVIVIDDDSDLYEDYVEIIKTRLDREGYLLANERYEELSELDENPLNDVDLFLVDLKFGSQDKGPEFINKIRENHLTDILFYSSDSRAIQKYRSSGEYQGVYFAIRDENKDEITPTINQLIEKMIKRSNTPSATRGIVLGCVAELDNIIKQKIVKLLGDLSLPQKKQLVEKCFRIFLDSYKGRFKKASDFFGCDFHKGMKTFDELKSEYTEFEIQELINNIYITDSNKNLSVLAVTHKVINGKNEAQNSIIEILALLEDRNVLAHVSEELDCNGCYRFKRPKKDEYLVLSPEKCRELRIDIIKHFSVVFNL